MTSADRWAVARACCALAMASIGVSAAAMPAACRADEDTLFSCSVGQKKVAVCASRNWSSQLGTLQYRFGPPKAAELVLPRAAGTLPSASATASSLMFSGGGGATLRFSSGNVDYIVYTAIGTSWGEASGVAVERDGKVLRSFKCRGKVTSMLGEAMFRDGGFKRDELPFEIPK